MKHLILLGGGFAGVWGALSAAAERKTHNAGDIAITLLSDCPDLVIRPRLYEGASADMRVALRPLMDAAGVRFAIGKATGIDTTARTIACAAGSSGAPTLATTLTYDALVLATGSRLRVPDIPGAAHYAYSNDTFADTVRLDRHLATLTPETAKVVVVGAGFTGLETATQLRQRLGEDACIVLVDQAPATDGALGPGPQPVVAKALADCRIETRASAEIVEIRKESIVLRDGEFITADAVVLTTGLEASPLTRAIAAKCDAAGRIRVSPDLQVPAIDGVFAAGDTAHAFADDAHVASMSCQHAIQLGRFAGHNAIRYLLGLNTRPYRQERYVTCLDLGPDGAMFSSGWQRVVLKTGAEAKAIKRQINRERIYPPLPSLPQHEIFAQAGLNQDAPPV